MSDTPNEKKFMREKVVKPPIDKRRAAGRILCYVLFAAVFGGVAAVSFVASLPTAKKLLGKEQPVTSAPITIERDQDPSGEPTPVETMAETTGEGIRAEDLKDEVDKIVGDAMEKFPWTTKNLTELNDAFRNIYLESEKSIVTVSAVKNDVDWFDNPIDDRTVCGNHHRGEFQRGADSDRTKRGGWSRLPAGDLWGRIHGGSRTEIPGHHLQDGSCQCEDR